MAGKHGVIRCRKAHLVAHSAPSGRSLTALCLLFITPVPLCTQVPSVSVSRFRSVSPPDRIWRPAAEAEGPDPGRHPQHQRGEAAPPGRSDRRRRLGLEEAAPLLPASGQMLHRTHGGCAVQLHVRVPGVSEFVDVAENRHRAFLFMYPVMKTERQFGHSVIRSQFKVKIVFQKYFPFCYN